MSSYMVLGGCGFIGRNIVHRLVQDPNCSKVVICDKRRPELSWLTDDQKKSFSDPKVLFKQINLANPTTVGPFFEKNPCDYVINSAAETRVKQSNELYEENIYKLGMLVAQEALKMKCRRFIQITSARIKILDIKNRPDDSIIGILKSQKKLEEGLATIQGLDYVILRPALVYGTGDKTSIVPLLILMAIYKYNKEECKLLWTENINICTVHVHDVVSACLHLAKLENPAKVYEICDKSNSTHGSITKIAANIYGVKYRFMGRWENVLVSTFFESVVSEINEKHMKPWSKVCKDEKIENSPLLPYFTEEQLILDDFKVDVGPLEATGFSLIYPKLEEAQLRSVIKEYVSQSLFPKKLAP